MAHDKNIVAVNFFSFSKQE